MPKFNKSLDERIKRSLLCPVCGYEYERHLYYDGRSSVFCQSCNFHKGGLDHLHAIDGEVYRNAIFVGGEWSARDQYLLDLMNIDAVVTVANDFPADVVPKVPRYYRVDLHDSTNNSVESYAMAVLAVGLAAASYVRGNPSEHDTERYFRWGEWRTLVHCMGGARRSVSVAAFYLTRGDRRAYWKLIRRFKKVRPVVETSGGIHEFVEKYMFDKTCLRCGKRTDGWIFCEGDGGKSCEAEWFLENRELMEMKKAPGCPEDLPQV